MSEPRRTAMEVFDAGIEERRKRAVAQDRHDHIFHAHVRQVVAYAMQHHGPIDPAYADREAADIALEVAALLLRTVYEEDSEVRNLAAERDRFRKIAEDAVAFSPPKFLFRESPK